MSQYAHPVMPVPAAELSEDARAAFLTRTYLHLFAALTGFVALEVALFKTGVADQLAGAMLQLPWLVILGAFMLIGYLFSGLAARAQSLPMQYVALGGYVVAEALIFLPLLYVAFAYQPTAVQSAAGVSLLGFTGLTGIALVSRRRFTALGAILKWVGLCAIGAIVGSLVFGFELGMWFNVAMVAFAGGAILHSTARVLHDYPEDRYVSASLELFAAVALLFWYVLRIFLSRD